MTEQEQKPQPSLARKIIHYGAVLMVVCLISGAGVGYLYVSARGRIEQNQRKAFQDKLADVLGDAKDPQPLGDYPESASQEEKTYVATTARKVRYAAMGSAQGYQSKILVLVSVDAKRAERPVGDDPKIFRVAVVASGETPGLGEEVNKVVADVSLWGAIFGAGKQTGSEPRRPAFQEQFSGKRLSDLVVDKSADTDKIVPVTGATITSTAVTAAARDAVQQIVDATRESYGEPTE